MNNPPETPPSDEPKRRVRPLGDKSVVSAQRARPDDEMAKRRADRKKRGVVDHGYNKNLALDETRLDKDNYTYRFVNDVPGRVERLKNIEYEVVPADEIGGQDVLHHGGLDKEGKAHPVVLMKKYKPWYDEDQAQKVDFRKAQEEALMRGRDASLRENGGGAEYAPPSNSVSAVDMRVPKGAPPGDFQP